MLLNLKPSHKDYFNYLLTSSITGYTDCRAGSSLLFLFPFYIQLGLAQIFYVLESITIDQFKLTDDYNLIDPYRLITLTNNLKEVPESPITQSLIKPKLDIVRYNKLFNFNIPSSIFEKNTKIVINTMGLIGDKSLFSVQEQILPRERLEKFFELTNFKIDNLDKVIDIAVNNNRIEAALIFCQYFDYPLYLTQQIINKIEVWILNN